MVVPTSAAYAVGEPRAPKREDPASAAELPDGPLGGAPARSGDFSAMVVELMPANCWGKSNDPHKTPRTTPARSPVKG